MTNGSGGDDYVLPGWTVDFDLNLDSENTNEVTIDLLDTGGGEFDLDLVAEGKSQVAIDLGTAGSSEFNLDLIGDNVNEVSLNLLYGGGNGDAWEGSVPAITSTTHIYQQDMAPDASSVPPPKDNDFWFKTPENHQYYYKSSAPGNHWVAVRDTGITDAQADADHAIVVAAAAQSTATTARTNANIAIANAGTAQSTADGKVRSFFQDGPPSGMLYGDIGDMWFDTNDGNKLYQWNGSFWELAQDQDIANAVTAAGEAQAIANTKITTFYTDTPPTSLAIGDLWVDIDDQNHLYRALTVGANEIRSTEWVSVRDAAIAAASASAAAANTAATDAMTAAEAAQATADGAIRTYYQSDPPSGLNDTDNLGDMWFDTDDGTAWRWNGSDWVIIQDTAIATALAAAQNAQTTADGKINAFYQISPPVTADLGDLWYDTNDKNKPYFCSAIDPVEWTPIRDLAIADAQLAATTANTAAVTAQEVADEAIASAATAQGIADGKTNTYFQLTEPTGMSTGDVDDLWFDTDDGNKMYRWTGTAWEVAQDQQIAAAITSAANANTAAGVANTLAGTKVVTFYQNNPPVATTIGDLWVDTDDNNKLYRASSIGVGGWESAQDKGIAAASAAASAANTAAANAMTAAQQAQATADGAVVTYYQTDPPWKVVPPAVDPSFETGVNGFSVVGTSPPGSTIASDGGRYKTGARSLKMTTGGSAGLVSASKAYPGIVADKTYTILVWAYAPTGITSGAASMSIRIGGTTVATAYNTTPSTVRDTWTPILTTYTAVASGTLTLYLYGSYGASQSTWWDDLAVVEGTITQNSVGDTWYDTDDNNAYRWTGTDWLLIVDTQVTEALRVAQNAQTTADGKITAYYQTNQPVSGKVGDLWYDTDDKNKPYYCSTETPLHWEPIRDGTIADALALADAGIAKANTAQSSADGKATTYFQFEPQWPDNSTGHALDDGDLWFDTNDGNKMYRWTESVKKWVLADDQRIASTITTVNGKITTYYQDDVPTSTAVGDLWVDTNDDNHLYRAFAVGANTITAGKWVSVRDDTIADAQAAADQAVYSYVNEYAVNASETVPPVVGSPSWSTATPLRTPGTFIWVRTITTRNDGTTTRSDPVLLTGNTGATPASITLTTSTQVLTQPATLGVTTPATAVVTGTAVSTTITKWEYSSDGGTFTTTPPPGAARTGNVVTITGSTMSAKTIAVKMSDASNVSDTMTVARVNSGAAGSTGGTGGAGADAYTVLLTNEAHTFAGDVTNAKAGSTTSQVLAYKAAVQMPATIGSFGTLPTGMSAVATNNGTATAGFTVTVTTALTQQNGTITVPVTVDGVSFSKIFSWAVSLTGTKGDQGPVSPAVWLTTTSQVLTAPPSGTGPTTPATVTVTGNASGSTSITTFTYSTDGGITFSATKPAGLAQTGLGPVTITGQTMTAKTIAVRAADAAGVSDTLTIAKLSDGAAGGAGADGADAYTILLSNEANVFPGSTTAAYAGSTTSKVLAYKGTVQVPATIGAFGTMPSGMTAVATNNGTITAGFTVTVTTSLVTPSGTFDVPITVGTTTFTKTFSWSLGLAGAKGDNAPAITMTATSQVMSVGLGGALTPPTVTLTGTAANTTIDRWEYSLDGAGFTVTKPPGVAQTGTGPVTVTGATLAAKTIAVKMSNILTGISDTITIAKVADGAAGADAYTVLLTNEAQVIPGTTTAGVAGTYTTQVIAYKGTTAMPATISNAAITGLPTGITSAVTGSGSTAATVTFTVTSSPALTSLGGQITIPVVVDSLTFNQVFSWSLSLTGAKGDTGTSASTISLTASSQALVSPAAGGVTTPPQSVITGTAANTTIGKWEASVNGAAYVALSTPPAGVAIAGNVVTITGATLAAATKSITVRMADAANVIYDTMTVSKVYDGATGADAYTVMLTNEAQVIPAGVTNAVGGTYTSKVIAYKGSTLMPVNITGITGQVTGMTAAADAQNNTTNAGFVVTATTALATTAGTLTVTMVVDGVTFTKTFAWTLSLTGAKGDTGATAPTITLSSPSHILTMPAIGGATSPASTTVTGVASAGTTITKYEYSVNGAAFLDTPLPAGVSRTGNVVTITGATLAAATKTVAVKMSDAAGISDTMTVAKVAEGAAGLDAYTVLLSNEASVFPGSTNAALAGAETSQVLAYKGTTQVPATIGTIAGQVTGMTTAITNQGTITAGFTVTVTTALVTKSGTLTVPIVVDGVAFTKKFSWSLSLTGASAPTIALTSTTQALVSPATGGATTPATATVTASVVSTAITTWDFSVNSGTFSTTAPPGVSLNTGTGVVTITGSAMAASTIAVRASNGAGVADSLTVAKVSDGAAGGTGGPGADAYTILLTNEAQVIPGTTTSALAGTFTTDVIAYKGATQIPSTIGTLSGTPWPVTGLTAAASNQGMSTNRLTVTVLNTLVATGGTITIPITADGKTFTKTLSWSLSLVGQPGTNAPTVTLTSPAQTLVSPAAGGVTTPASTTVTGVATGTTISTWDYSVNGGAFGAAPAGVSLNAGTGVVTITGGTLATSTSTVAVRATTAAGIADTMTIAKVAVGADAYTVVLTNEAQVFAGTTNAATTASTTSNVLAYKGATQIISTVQSITTGVAGITATPINPGSLSAGFTVSVGPALLTQSGEFPVTILVDGISFTKRFSWSVSYTGPKGDTGSSAAIITLTSTAQALVATPGTTPTTPTTAVITGTAQSTTIDKYEYSTDGGSTWIVDPTRPTGVARTGNAVTVTGGTMTANAVAVKMSNTASGVMDIYTVAKVSNGAGITGTTVTYQVGSSGTTAPTGTWVASPPAVPAGQFLWTRTVTNYSDGTSNILSPAYAISAAGATGVGISNTVVTYQVGSSATTTPTGTWVSTPQATTVGTFLWTRTLTTFTDASTSTSYSIAAHGSTGTAGVDAYTVLLSNEAAVFPGTTTTAANGGTASGVVSVYKGPNLISASVSQPTVPTGMTATLTNNPGTSPGYKFDVTTALTAQSGQVSLTITADGKTFTGIFSWAVSYTGAKGDTGASAATVTLTSTTQALISGPSGTGATTPTTAVVTGTASGAPISVWEASVNGGAFAALSTPPAGVVLAGNVATITGASLAASTSTVAIRMGNGVVSDTLTVAKVLNGAAGSAGVGISGTTVTYQVHSNGTTAPTGTWVATPQTTVPGQFLWTRTVTTYTDSSNSTAYSVAAHGTTGSSGVGISNTAVTYQVNTNGTIAPTGTWVATPQATTPGQFLWTRTVTTYSDTTSSTAYSVSAHGATGSAGVGITGTTVTYQVHTSGTAAPTGTWVTSPVPVAPPGQFLWTRTITSYSDTTSSTSYSVAAAGMTGGTGVGISNTVVTYQVHTNGTTAPTGTWVSTPQATTTGQFLWTRTVTTLTDASTTTAYSVSAHGAAGADAYTILLTNEAQVFAATTTAAINASVVCNVIAYKGATLIPASVGTITGLPSAGMTATVIAGNQNTTNAGFTVAVTSALTTTVAPTAQGLLTVPITADNKTFNQTFSWALSLAGANAATIKLTPTTQTLITPADGVGATTPPTSVVTGTATNTTIDKYEYSTDGGTTWGTVLPTGVVKPTGNVVTLTGATMTATTVGIRMTNTATGVGDTLTVAKVLNGADAYTVMLENENHTFPGTITSAVGGAITTKVISYKGITPIISHVNAITGATGISAAATTNDSTASVITITVTTALVTGGTLDIPIVVDGKTFTKKFTYSVSLVGQTGAAAPTVALTSPAQTLMSPAAGGATTPATTTVTGTPVGTTITLWEASVNGAAFTSLSPTPPAGVSAPVANVVTITGATLAANVSTVALRATTAAAGVADTMTIAKVYAGADAYTVLLSNEAAVFPGTNTAVVNGSQASGTVSVYKGATPINCVLTVPATGSLPTGLTVAIAGTASAPTYVFTAATALVGASGQVVMKVVADGQTFNPVFSWSISYTGVSITATTPFFALVATNAAAPVQPTNQATPPNQVTPPVTWVTTEPAYTANTDLYRTERYTYSNTTYAYSAVTKVSSYAAASTKIQTYYLPGFTGGPDPAWQNPDPINNPGATRGMWVPIQGRAVGDLWYQTDDDYHLWVWDGTVWLDATNPDVKFKQAIEQGEANTGQIGDLNTSLELTSSTAQSAQELALSADGRITMSDYEPSPTNVAGRSQGSVWFTRTRKRINLCTNPSFEVSTADWLGTIATIARVQATPAIDGNYVLQVTNTATATEHAVYWGSTVAVRPKVTEGQTYTCSVYVKHVIGTGKQFRMRILWYNAAQVKIQDDYSPYVDISTPVPPAVTTDWVRLWITVTAPATADTFYVRINSQPSNVNDVWLVDGLLVEQDDALGRYFDGDSFDGAWSNPAKPDLSTSTLVGDKISRVFEMQDENWVRKFFSEDSLTSLNALKLVGTLDSAMIADDSIAPDKMATPQVVASEALTAGSMVNVWNDKGAFKVRKADASLGYEAHGFVVQAVAINTSVRVLFNGYNPYVANLVPGTQYLSTGGAVTAQPPSTTGRLVQRVGFAPLSVVLDFSPAQAIKIF